MKFAEYEQYGLPLLRAGLAAVYLYFGLSQLLNPTKFTGWLPSEAALIPLSATTLILLNGILEVTLGTLLLAGAYTRIAAFILGLHLLGITLTIGFTETGVRDFGLAIATLAITLTGPGGWSMDKQKK